MAARDRRLLGRRARLHRRALLGPPLAPPGRGAPDRGRPAAHAGAAPAGAGAPRRRGQAALRRARGRARRGSRRASTAPSASRPTTSISSPICPPERGRRRAIRSAVIVADYELMADLATFYGHVEELRWRLRFKAEPAVDEEVGQPDHRHVRQPDGRRGRRPARAGARADGEPAGRADRRRAADKRPTRVARTRQFTGAIRAQTPEEIEKALAAQSLPGLEGAPEKPDGSA